MLQPSCAHAPARLLAPCGRRGSFRRRRGRADDLAVVAIAIVSRRRQLRRGLAIAKPRGFCDQPGMSPEQRKRKQKQKKWTATWRWLIQAQTWKGCGCDQLCAVKRRDLKDLAAYSR